MDTLGTSLTTGGSLGIVIAFLYFLVKCLQHKKIVSKCCNNQISIQEEPERKEDT